MKRQVKTKFISILLIIFILVDMFSPYSILLNKSYASSGNGLSVKPSVVFNRTSGIQEHEMDGNTIRYFEAEIGLLGDENNTIDGAWVAGVAQINLKYDENILALINTTYDTLDYTEAVIQETGRGNKVPDFLNNIVHGDGYLKLVYGETQTNINQIANGTIRIEAEQNGGMDPVYYSELKNSTVDGKPYLPIASMRFAVLEDSVSESNLTTDLVKLFPTAALPSGMEITYYDDYDTWYKKDISLEKYINSEDYFTYSGFVEADEETDIISTVVMTTAPTDNIYEHGDSVTAKDLAGGIITVTYASGKTETIEMAKQDEEGNYQIADDLVIDQSNVGVGDTKLTGTYLGKYPIEIPITVEDPVASIEVSAQPSKTDYYNEGETIDLTGAKIKPKTKSGAYLDEISLPNENVKVSETIASVRSERFEAGTPDDNGLERGRQTITLTYEGASVDLGILVNDTVKSITVQGYKQSYEWGDSLDKTQGTVTAYTTGGYALAPVGFDNGSVEILDFDSSSATTQTITVKYMGKSTTYQVTVTDPIKNIIVEPLPQTTYNPEEDLVLTGSYVYEQRKSGAKVSSSKTELTTAMISNYNNKVPGTQTLTVSYANKTTTFDVTVLDIVKSISVSGMITEYKYGALGLNISNAMVIPTLYSGKVETAIPLKNSMIISTFDSEKVGPQAVIIQYEGVQTTVTVNVSDIVESISMSATPKTRYYYGESLNVEGGEITVKWAHGTETTTKLLTDSDVIIQDNGVAFDSKPTFPEGKTTVTKPLTVYYGGASTTYNVTIVNEVTGIVMQTLPKVEYNIKDTLDLTDGKITVTRQNGTTEDIPLTDDRVEVTGLNTSTGAINQELTVTFTENDVSATTTYEVDVIDKVKSIEVISQPDKKEYGWGEALNLTGAKINVTYGSGTKPIDVTADMITNYNSKQTGKQNLIVEYPIGSEIVSKVTIPITVVDKLDSIKMNEIKTSEYQLNGTINMNEEFTLTRQSGATETKTIGDSGVEIIGFSSDTESNSRRVTIKYTEKYTESSVSEEDHYDIQVLDRISKIEVTTKPKTTYNYEELFSTTDGKVTVTKVSGKTEIIDLSTCDVTGYDSTKIDKQTITVTYTKYGDTKTCTYEVEVKDFLDYITVTPPTTVDYGYGVPLDLTGGIVTKHMKSGKEIPIALDDPEVKIEDIETITQQIGDDLPVTVKVGEKSATFTINVQDEIDSIELAEGTSIQTVYKYKEDFNPNGAYYIIKSKANPNGSIKEITSGMVKGFDSTVLTENEPTGSRELTITVAGKEFKYSYTVNNYVTGIELIAPKNTRYSYSKISDGTLDITGATVKKIMAYTDPDDEVIPIGLGATGVEYGILDADGTSLVKGKYDPDLLGTQTVYVRYAGEEETFTVVVRDELVSIEIDTTNGEIDKEYIYDDPFNANGARLKVNYLSKSQTIPIAESMLTNFYTNGDGALTNGEARTATISYSWADADDPIKTATATFTYEVEDEVKEVLLTPPTNRVYYYGLSSELDLSGRNSSKSNEEWNHSTNCRFKRY